MARDTCWDVGWEYKKNFNNEKDLQDTLRERMLLFIKNEKVTQKQIARETDINEGALSNWKNQKPIGISALSCKVSNYYLDTPSVGSLHSLLLKYGY